MNKLGVSNISKCPVDFAFKRMGGKYKARVLWSLRDKVLRYGELRRLISDITPKMLTQVLRELEEDNLVTRKEYIELPPRVEYTLTATGEQLIPTIRLLALWGQDQMMIQGLTPSE